MTVLLCGHCGSPRHGGAPAYRCACIPAQVWQAPDLARAVRALDLSKVIRYLRRHPATQHHSQAALASMCGLSQTTLSRLEGGRGATRIDRAVTALAGLGAPQVPGEVNNPYPDEDPPPPPGPNGGPPGEVALTVGADGPRRLLDHGTAWGVTNTPRGATDWFALPTPANHALPRSPHPKGNTGPAVPDGAAPPGTGPTGRGGPWAGGGQGLGWSG
ncbi:helix-turn-helix transcriptional regulator [Nocardiopsis sp. CNT312]|uniref:helix-turn-helix domain-containing protein n=1 Tax=Nocardiopsis sp. CNT312 TaxID=1137268 RepID=UPI0004B65A87|nr:helix-turn-helix transcriptional regulator [Nocardiopsis sp. CNT312]